ncbi:bifunctional phosphoribosylaminoimidazolecarboxamide formyltransferase/IMP cyclohydrolase [Algihabitans albus]|uniref:bifunctional phosphoribosylaminoimidazolecarboxamide formyltransferase/IMP cyclohydrolase n=1 Tax=Algihabitans albus TaxID=2164067 RepID=UPI000E5D67C4|nr:bifunctional phosphoribosylaminoimidazolecarboxamide formyltransferase/IMP cyclohydrolase [Algihabitans albus]
MSNAADVSDNPDADLDQIPLRRALLSVSDKHGLIDLARALHDGGVELISTGGTAKAIAEAGLPVGEVAETTGFPEILDGRVKTLHPLVHGGLLGKRSDPTHTEQMAAHGIQPIDLLVVNLYPFRETVARGGDFQACIENIDIGGPAMIRAAAKNHGAVAVLTDPADYPALLAELAAEGGRTGAALRRRLAAAAFSHTAGYDAAVSGWFAQQLGDPLPKEIALAGTRVETLRYGENPHQEAAFYRAGKARPGVATAEQLQGKQLSYNNINDTDAAFELVAEFERPAVAIIKHANPCGVAEGESLSGAYAQALACDPVSAFGGIIAVNRSLDAATAEKIAELFAEVVIAPEVEGDARDLLASKKNLRLLITGGLPDPAEAGTTAKTVSGGLLVQSRDSGRIAADQLRAVTRRQPSEAEIADLLFAFRVAKHVKSNAIVYARSGATLGIGAGQMSRVDSARIAAIKAEQAFGAGAAKGCVVASDAFFPFADGLLAAVEAGATAVIQPGGSVRDEEVIAAADDAGLAMVFTGLRHFRH